MNTDSKLSHPISKQFHLVTIRGAQPFQRLSKRSLHLGAKKPINRKHINIFLTALVGQSSQGQTPTRPRDKPLRNGNFNVEFNRKRPVCPRGGSEFVAGRGPVCPRDSSCLSRRPSGPKCLCLLVFFHARLKGFHKPMSKQVQTVSIRRAQPFQRLSERKGFGRFLMGLV